MFRSTAVTYRERQKDRKKKKKESERSEPKPEMESESNLFKWPQKIGGNGERRYSQCTNGCASILSFL